MRFQIGQTLSAQLTWSHYVELLNLDDVNKTNYYIDISIKNNLIQKQNSFWPIINKNIGKRSIVNRKNDILFNFNIV